MCRFVAYHGPEVALDELLYKPKHSLVHQSTHAMEREEPLNGDGWGVGWYAPAVAEQPGLYRTLHPAWSDDNMRHVAPLVRTPVFLAHVRAASPGLPVQQLNCHPFRGGQHTHEEPEDLPDLHRGRQRLLFMHNGNIGAYRSIIRRLSNDLPDDLYFSVRGSTDSEHVFALVQHHLGKAALEPSPEDLLSALEAALAELKMLKEEAGQPEAVTHANLCITDGRSLVATRYADPKGTDAPSLYLGQAASFYCDASRRFRCEGPDETGATLVASERLWDDERVWQKIPRDHAALVSQDDGPARVVEMDAGGVT